MISWLLTYLPVLERFRGWTWYSYIILFFLFRGLTFGREFMLVSWGLIFGGAYIRGGLYSGFYGICGTSLPEYMGTGDRNEKFLAIFLHNGFCFWPCDAKQRIKLFWPYFDYIKNAMLPIEIIASKSYWKISGYHQTQIPSKWETIYVI